MNMHEMRKQWLQKRPIDKLTLLFICYVGMLYERQMYVVFVTFFGHMNAEWSSLSLFSTICSYPGIYTCLYMYREVVRSFLTNYVITISMVVALFKHANQII